MIKMRSGVFETNSSSTHSISIPRKKVNIDGYKGTIIRFVVDCFGWEWGKADPWSYLYTCIVTSPDDLKDMFLEKLGNILTKNGIDYEFVDPPLDDHGYPDCYIDHNEPGFARWVLDDEDRTLRYLFGDTIVATGNDNESYQKSYPETYYADEEVWDDEVGSWVPNENYKPDEYEYFYKGN